MQLFFTSLLLDVHMWLNMFRASPRPSSGAYNCTRSLWFYLWKERSEALLYLNRMMMYGLANVECLRYI
jgi:hypothetical protein